MALKIRLRRQGRTHLPFFRIVLMDSREPRDGKYVEMVGWYNQVAKKEDEIISVNTDRIQHWMEAGAQLSENAADIIFKAAPELGKWNTQREVARREARRIKRRAASKKKSAA